MPEVSGTARRPGLDLYADDSGSPTHRILYEGGKFHVYEINEDDELDELFSAKPSRIVARLKRLAGSI